MTQARPREIPERSDDYFFSAMVALIIVVVFVGFAKTYYLAGVFHAPKLPSLLVHLHGAVFTCWILLLLTQVVLASAGRVRWHMQLGLLGIILAPLMVILGYATLLAGVRRGRIDPVLPNEVILTYDGLHVALFAVLFAWGFLARRDSVAHKRLMFLATVALLGPALSRWEFSFMPASAFGFFLLLDSFLIFLVVFDLWSRRRIHSATLCGSLAIVALQFAYLP